ETDRVVAPVVRESSVQQDRVLRIRMDRQELDGGDPEALDVIDDGLLAEPLEVAAQLRRDRRMQHRVAAHVRLVGSITWHLGIRGALSRTSNVRSLSRSASSR